MTIYNCDGTVFRTQGTLQQFDPESPNHNLFNSFDREAIRIGGSPLLYYEVFIQVTNIDKLYVEDRSKLWSPVPIQFFGYYEPMEPQNPSTQFGIDGIGEVMFECNYREVLGAIGHMPKWGSKIQTPHLNEFWVVVNTRVALFQLWGALHLQLICERLRPTTTDATTTSTPPRPDFNIF